MKFTVRTAVFVFAMLLIPAGSATARDLFLLQDMCVRCHLLGENYGKRNAVLGWRAGVHFSADSGCADCHGGNKFLYIDFKDGHIGLPDRAEAVEICGKCHTREKADFMSSRSSKPEEFTCTVTCVDCHGYHHVTAAGPGIFKESNCGGCHSFERVVPLREAAIKVNRTMANIEGMIDMRRNEHFPVRSFSAKLDKSRVEYSGYIHSLPMRKAEESIGTETLKSLDELKDAMDEASPRKWKIEGSAVVIFLAVLALVLVRYQAIMDKMDKSDRE